ncbi:hemerythrin HHE cation binding domain-containing protein [Fluviicoccus keumensis]|uniref:Hemerythrin HHE cation binding domain-containing protein n=1 Tax=Fluviicoccus keumensis TaxID=1435465 RepID=A0A4Q7ZBJ2_9GAMM|nr:hemerythrin domain-containing protein [Fluviicoccus keumensis]RZU47987.1 hemerythrin HHE cation binding domain-containing protein [Fluviicoccus keumensis]
MSAPRFDIYRFIHKGLRAYLAETLLQVGRVDFEVYADLHRTMAELDGLLDFCESHLHHENTFIHPAMQAAVPGSADSMDAHHREHMTLIWELRELADRARACEPGAREGVLAALYRKLALFVADNLAHMDEEESRNNALLWRHYSDAQIIGIHDRLVASIPPEENAVAMQWMLTAFNPSERHRLLDSVRQEAPRPVLDGLLALARGVLPAPDWQKLQLAMGV